jgi:AcrR family transcriptional regulator
LREVARRADVTAAAVYRHFDGKDALLGAVCAEGFRVFASYLMTALAKPKPRDRMRAAIAQYLRFALERPRDYRVMFMSEPAFRRDVAPPTLRAPDPSFQFLVDRVTECQAEKILRKGDARELALSIWAHLHGLVALFSSDLLPLDVRAFAAFYERSTDDFLRGLAP